mmetsp:Transcript_30256/g.45835  ORF Transcript_30256/g.45835 Transcript_30256/m.45835 type:complete len:221 (+) Transcript_30256:599-1261(+)
MLRDRVSFNLDNLSSLDLVPGTVSDGLLVLLDGRSVYDSSSSNSNMIIFRKDPTVEIWRNIVANIHFSHFFVKFHFFFRDLNSLLESNCKIVLASIHSLGNSGVSSISSNDNINIHGLLDTSFGSFLVLLVMNFVFVLGGLMIRWYVNASDKAIYTLSTVFNSTVTDVTIENLTPAHSNVFIRLKCFADVDLNTSRGDQIHFANLTIDNCLRKIKFANHA